MKILGRVVRNFFNYFFSGIFFFYMHLERHIILCIMKGILCILKG